MNNLLRANFTRMIKDKVFWFCVAGSILFGVFICTTAYHDMKKYGSLFAPDEFMFRIFMLSGIFAAVFSSLFIGTEYSDGTIRNKLVVGRTRTKIYLANFLTVAAANVLICFAFMLTTLVIGIPMFGWLSLAPKTLLYFFAVGMLMVVSISALCNLLSMLNQNKAFAAVISILLVVGAFVYTTYANSMLNMPEVYEGYTFMDEKGNIQNGEEMPNPNYPRGFRRDFFEFVMDFVPVGQGLQLSQLEAPRPAVLPVYSILIILTANTVGIFFFRRKDLK